MHCRGATASQEPVLLILSQSRYAGHTCIHAHAHAHAHACGYTSTRTHARTYICTQACG